MCVAHRSASVISKLRLLASPVLPTSEVDKKREANTTISTLLHHTLTYRTYSSMYSIYINIHTVAYATQDGQMLYLISLSQPLTL